MTEENEINGNEKNQFADISTDTLILMAQHIALDISEISEQLEIAKITKNNDTTWFHSALRARRLKKISISDINKEISFRNKKTFKKDKQEKEQEFNSIYERLSDIEKIEVDNLISTKGDYHKLMFVKQVYAKRKSIPTEEDDFIKTLNDEERKEIEELLKCFPLSTAMGLFKANKKYNFAERKREEKRKVAREEEIKEQESFIRTAKRMLDEDTFNAIMDAHIFARRGIIRSTEK